MSIGWKNEANYKFIDRVADLLRLMYNILDRYLFCLGSKAKYLRKRGVKIGVNSSILTATKNFGSEPWLIEIGDKVTVTNGVVFINHDGASRVFRNTIAGSSRFGNKFGTIIIGDNSFIGINSILLPGSRIGSNVIVAAGSVVAGELSPDSIYGGVPAKRICSLEEYIEKYKSSMIEIRSMNRRDLRSELTKLLWGEIR